MEVSRREGKLSENNPRWHGCLDVQEGIMGEQIWSKAFVHVRALRKKQGGKSHSEREQ